MGSCRSFSVYGQAEGRISREQPRYVPAGGNCRVQREVIWLAHSHVGPSPVSITSMGMSRSCWRNPQEVMVSCSMISRATETFQFDEIDDVLSDIAKGRMVIVTDDADRENEGDLVMAAEKVTPEAVN